MESTTFEEKIIPKINGILKFVLENPYSDFYRNKYKNAEIKEIKSYADFQKIPFLTKDEILSTDLEGRFFVSRDKIIRYAISSGTSNHKKPAIIPLSANTREVIGEHRTITNRIKSLGVNQLLILWPPLTSLFSSYPNNSTNDLRIVRGDIYNLELMATIAKEIKIQGINTTPTILYFFIEQLKKINFDLGEIKWISLGGEFCSAQKAEYFNSELPNVFIDFRYGSSEARNIGYRCGSLACNNPPSNFHPNRTSFTEVIAENNSLSPLDKTGEIIYTHLKTMAFPLIRYKTGDMGCLSKHKCRCGNNYLLAIGGRSGSDVLKFSGVTLYVELIADALKSATETLEPKFQMHVFEIKTKNGLRPKLELHIKLKKESESLKDDPAFKKMLTEKISNNLKLSAKNNLKQLVDQNIFLPLEIIFVNSWPENETKAKNIISHL